METIKNGNALGTLTIEDIHKLLNTRTVLRFNCSEAPSVVLGRGDWFNVRRSGYPEYTFNENGAPDAVLVGNVLTMPDAQGFVCTFELESKD